MTQNEGGLRTGEVARLLDVAERRVVNLIRHRLIGAPPIVGGRRLWRSIDVEAARRVLVARGVIAGNTVAAAMHPPLGASDRVLRLDVELDEKASLIGLSATVRPCRTRTSAPCCR